MAWTDFHHQSVLESGKPTIIYTYILNNWNFFHDVFYMFLGWSLKFPNLAPRPGILPEANPQSYAPAWYRTWCCTTTRLGNLPIQQGNEEHMKKKHGNRKVLPFFFSLNLVGWNVNGLRLKQSNISITLAMDIHWFIGQCECIFSFVSTWKMLAV